MSVVTPQAADGEFSGGLHKVGTFTCKFLKRQRTARLLLLEDALKVETPSGLFPGVGSEVAGRVTLG